MANPGEDRPVVVGGGSHHITVEIPDASSGYPPQTFSLAPKDPAVPFKEIVITSGAKQIIRWKLSKNWKITIR
jgi:hypothetical protein